CGPTTTARRPNSSAAGGRSSSARVEPHVSQLFGWVAADAAADAGAVLDGMAAALAVDAAQRLGCWVRAGMAIGGLGGPLPRGDAGDLEPAVTADRRFTLWMAGEAFASYDPALKLRDAAESRTGAFRRALLDRWLESGAAAIRALDGEYHVAVWDAVEL